VAAPVRKDDEVELRVDSLAYGGNGVARLDGFVVFVRRGLPGDTVRARVTKVKRGFAEALATEVLEPSPHRVEAPCAHYPACGGCRFQDLDYAVQAQAKEDQVRDSLQRIAGIAEPPLEPILPAASQFFYRNKLEYSFTQTPSGPALGFHKAGRWDEVLEVEKCWLTTDLGNAIRNAVRDWAREEGLEAYDQAEGTGYLRHLVVREGRNTGQALVLLVTGKGERFERDYLVRRGRRVARCIDVRLPRHKPVRVDRDEALRVRRKAGQPRSHEAREADHSLHGDRSRRDKRQLAVAEFGRMALVEDLDTALAEQLPRGLRGRATEEVERRRLRGHQREVRLGSPLARDLVGGHQRKLIDRERPGRAGRDRERHVLDAAARELEQQGTHPRSEPRALDGEAAGDGRDGLRADRHEQDVVRERAAVPGDDGVFIGVHAPDAGQVDGRAVRGRDLHDVEALRLAVSERLADHQRPVGEVRLRRHEFDRHPLLRKRPQRYQRLERRDATPDDQYLQCAATCHGDRIARVRLRDIRESPSSRSVIYRSYRSIRS
jgi:predicted RNA-binding protein with TRAM domain